MGNILENILENIKKIKKKYIKASKVHGLSCMRNLKVVTFFPI